MISHLYKWNHSGNGSTEKSSVISSNIQSMNLQSYRQLYVGFVGVIHTT